MEITVCEFMVAFNKLKRSKEYNIEGYIKNLQFFLKQFKVYYDRKMSVETKLFDKGNDTFALIVCADGVVRISCPFQRYTNTETKASILAVEYNKLY